MKLALIQMRVTNSKSDNIYRACEQIKEQAFLGAEIVVLPEMFCCPYDTKLFRKYAEESGGLAQIAMSSLAKALGIYIVAGSIPELAGDKIYNTSFVYDINGNQIARHRKMHLFDVNIAGGQCFCESEVLSAGDELTIFDTKFGKIGLCICFDIRFSELSRLMALAGAKLIIVPAAFNMTTGPRHWQLHFRARAVDNQIYMAGAAPARDINADYISYAHSIVCNPWGDVVCDLGVEENSQIIDINLDDIEAVRKQLPILSARRTELYKIELLEDKMYK